MRPHPRTRKTIKWSSTAATLLLLATWLASGWYSAGCFPRRLPCVVIESGRLMIITHDRTTHIQSQSADVLRLGILQAWTNGAPAGEPRYQWRLTIYNSGQISWWLIPLWLPTLPILLTTATAWRLDTLARRRATLNHCPTCNYNLTGLPTPTTKCPECGSTTSPPRRGART